METFKCHKSFLVLFLLIIHCSSVYHGEVESPSGTAMEEVTAQQEEATAPLQDGGNMLFIASPPRPTLINRNSPSTQQPQPLYQQLNYPEQTLNQPISGLTQPLSSINQPLLGVTLPYSTFNQPFGASNQQGLADNAAFPNGASKEKRFIVGFAVVSLTTSLAALEFIV